MFRIQILCRNQKNHVKTGKEEPMLLYDNRIRVIVGHSGSGKTEFALIMPFS